MREIAQVFLKLGIIGFGGPAAHIAMMQEEIVEKRKWLTMQHFLDLMGATNLIPGPNSTEMTMHCGHVRGGWIGLVVAGTCFITPAVLLTMIFAYLYQSYGQLPAVQPYIFGVKPAVIAIILSAVYKLSKKAIKGKTTGVLAVLALMACLLGASEIVALFGSGLLAVLVYYYYNKKESSSGIQQQYWLPVLLLQTKTIPTAASIAGWKIFWIFLKIGAILYGSGYVLFAFLDTELVQTGLLSQQELIDAVAVGQMTPGPVLTTATFIGWQLGGWLGALVATLGIFLPSFLFVALLQPLVTKMRSSKPLGAFLDGVNAAAVAVILAVCITMGQAVLVDWRAIFIAILSGIVVFQFKQVNAAFVVIGGAVLGYVLLLI